MPSVTKQKNVASRKKTGGVLDRIAPIGFDDDDGISLSLYGRSGTGKTTLWATFTKPILAIVCSSVVRPGELRSIDTPEYRKTVKQVVLQESTELRELIAYAAESDFGTVVLDHASGLQDLVLKEILGLDELPAQKSWGMASQAQYGQCSAQVKEMLRALLALRCNRVIVAQERDFNNDGESELLLPSVGSALIPSLTGWLNPACDYICQTFIREQMATVESKIGDKKVKTFKKTGKVEYCLRTGPNSVYTSKFRVPRGHELPDVLVDPTYDKIMELIRGG